MLEELSEANSYHIVAETKRGLVGNVRLKQMALPCHVHLPHTVELSRLYLADGEQGRGIGVALMRGALKTAVRLGYQHCWLGVWQKNGRAIRFYRRWGFQIVGTMSLKVGQSAPAGWLMSKTL